jgi:GntR family transcriptional regulator/MocR family aminotransferase
MDGHLSAELIASAFASQPARGGLRNRLYLAVRHAILSGRLVAGSELPSSRSLAAELGVARNTVLRAYEQLLAEGYVVGRHGSGTYVSDAVAPERGTTRPSSGRASPVVLSKRGGELLGAAASSRLQAGAFIPGVPDVSRFPFAVWRRLLGRHLRHESRQLAQYGFGGYGPLKAALANYLGVTRMMMCTPQQVVIVNGTHQAVDLAARLLADPGDQAWMEDPGYWGARNVLRASGLELIPQPVDACGLAVRPGDRERPPRLIFVSPSSQYPTGAVMSLERRLDLLDFAARHDAWIIEDDYDNEIRYHPQPLASLFGLSRAQRVIYVGTFSKVLYPGLRLAYMVVPPALVDAFTVGNAELYREGRLAEQAALAEFIEGGHFGTHIRRMRGIYHERLDTLRGLLQNTLGGAITCLGGHAGLHLPVRFEVPLDDRALSALALQQGVICLPLSSYSSSAETRQSGMVLGFAPVPAERIRAPAEVLLRLIEGLIAGGAKRR